MAGPLWRGACSVIYNSAKMKEKTHTDPLRALSLTPPDCRKAIWATSRSHGWDLSYVADVGVATRLHFLLMRIWFRSPGRFSLTTVCLPIFKMFTTCYKSEVIFHFPWKCICEIWKLIKAIFHRNSTASVAFKNGWTHFPPWSNTAENKNLADVSRGNIILPGVH